MIQVRVYGWLCTPSGRRIAVVPDLDCQDCGGTGIRVRPTPHPISGRRRSNCDCLRPRPDLVPGDPMAAAIAKAEGE